MAANVACFPYEKKGQDIYSHLGRGEKVEAFLKSPDFYLAQKGADCLLSPLVYIAEGINGTSGKDLIRLCKVKTNVGALHSFYC